MKNVSLKVNAALNGLKQCLGILFPLITFPYVSRALGEDGFGQYSFSWSVISYFVLFAGLGINTYAMREGVKIRDNKAEINRFCSEAFTINFITTLISFAILFTAILFSEKIRVYFPLIMIQSMAMILNLEGRDWINSIFEDYLYITVRYLAIQMVSLILMFLLIKEPSDVWKYCIIAIFSSFGGNIPNIFYAKKYADTRITRRPEIERHLPGLLILFITQIAITIYVNADITMLGFYASDSVVGIYSLASKIYSMIKQVVNAMVIVTLPRMTYILQNTPEEYEGILKKISSFLTVILLPMACGVFMLSEELILIAGGPGYLVGKVSLKILSAAMILAVFGSFCMNSILIAHGLEKECLKATAISAVSNVVLNFAALPLLGMDGAAITTILAEALNLIILLNSSGKVVELKMFDLLHILQCALACISVIGVCKVLKSFCSGAGATLLLSVICSSVVYFSVLLIMDNKYIKELINIFLTGKKRGE